MNKKYRKQIPKKKYDKATGKYVKARVSIRDLEKAGHRLDGKSCPKCHRKPCWSKANANALVIKIANKPVEEAPKKKFEKWSSDQETEPSEDQIFAETVDRLWKKQVRRD